MRWNDASDWVWSAEQMHEAIVTSEEFTAAQSQMAAGIHRPASFKTRRAKRRYVLSGRVHCSLCGHRMQGNFNHDAYHYRCKFTSDRASISGLDHPKSVYVRESGHRLEARRVDRHPLRPLESRGHVRCSCHGWVVPMTSTMPASRL